MTPLRKTIADDINSIIENTLQIEKILNKTILISGATGMLLTEPALALSKLFRENAPNSRLILTVRNIDRAKKRMTDLDPNFQADFVLSDFNKPLILDQPPDIIIHGAGNGDPSTHRSDWRSIVNANIEGTSHLLNLANQKKLTKFIYISSGAIYGNNGNNEYVSEEFRGEIDENDIYGKSKTIGEWLCMRAHFLDQQDVRILRPAHFYGPTCKIEIDTRVVAEFMRCGITKKTITLRSQGNDKRSFGYISDFATALFKIIISGKSGNAYNVGNDSEYRSIMNLARFFAEEYDLQIFSPPPSENETSTAMLMKSEKLLKLGWQPLIDLKTGTNRMREAFKTQPKS